MKRGERKPYFANVPQSFRPVNLGQTHTYFIQGRFTGLIKSVARVALRLKEMQASSPDMLVLLGSTPRDIEVETHAIFANQRHHGEWFAPSSELLLYIQQVIDKDFS